MCVPLAIGLAAASAATSMAGQFMQGQASYTNAKYQEAAATANAAQQAQNAKDQTTLTQQEAARRYRSASQTEGTQQAAMAANGIDINYGSAADVLSDDKKIVNEDVGSIYTEGQRRALGYLTDSYNARLKASAAASEAKAAPIATGIGMLGTALGAASQISKFNAQSNFGGG